MRRFVVALVVLAQATTAAQQRPSQQLPSFRASTLLIVQSVTVTDRIGKPVEGLTAPDFVLTEDGVAQPIAFVEYQKLDAPPLGTAEVTPSVPARPAAAIPNVTRNAAAATLPPGDSRYRGRRLIVLYIDLASLSFFDEIRVFGSMRKYLDTAMTAADLVSVLVYQDGRVQKKQDFTDDRAALGEVVAGLERASMDSDQGLTVDDAAAGAFGEDAGAFNLFTMDRRLAALQTAAADLAALPELKTLVYFGAGLRMDTANLAQMRATVNAAVRANVTINPIDTRGLTATAPLGNAAQASPGGIGMFSGAMVQGAVRRQQSSQDAYFALAKDTGGRAMVDHNDLSMGIAQAAQAVTGYYLIGYYTTNIAKDGRFRRVKVSLAGGVGGNADLSYRPGYYGGKEWSKFNTYDRERQLEEALRLEDPITEIPMAVEINYFQLNSAEYFVPISVRMPGSELARPRPAGGTNAAIDMISEIKDEYGVTMRNARDRLEFRLDRASSADVGRRPIQYESGFTLLPGNYVIKVLARDATTGRIGTYLESFAIPNLEREKTRLPISTVVLSTQRVVPVDALDTVEQRIAATVANPLVHDGLRLIPSVGRTFSASRPVFIYLQAYERDAATIRPLVAFATLYRDGVKVHETSPAGVEVWDPTSKALPIRLHLGPGQLLPGTYELQVTVLDPAADRAAFWRTAVAFIR